MTGRRAVLCRTAARVASIAVCVAAVAGCGPGSGGGGGAGLIASAHRPPAPAIAGTDLQGRPVALADWSGSVVVVNFFSAACGQCAGDAELLAAEERGREGTGVRFVGVDVSDEDPQQPQAFLREHGAGYPSLFDPTGALVLGLPDGFVDPRALPATVVIDRRGRVATRLDGALTGARIRAVLDALAEESGW